MRRLIGIVVFRLLAFPSTSLGTEISYWGDLSGDHSRQSQWLPQIGLSLHAWSIGVAVPVIQSAETGVRLIDPWLAVGRDTPLTNIEFRLHLPVGSHSREIRRLGAIECVLNQKIETGWGALSLEGSIRVRWDRYAEVNDLPSWRVEAVPTLVFRLFKKFETFASYEFVTSRGLSPETEAAFYSLDSSLWKTGFRWNPHSEFVLAPWISQARLAENEEGRKVSPLSFGISWGLTF